MKLKVELEIEVGDIPAKEQMEYGFGDEGCIFKASDYEAHEIAGILTSEDHSVWEEHFAGSDILVSFDRVSVTSARYVE